MLGLSRLASSCDSAWLCTWGGTSVDRRSCSSSDAMRASRSLTFLRALCAAVPADDDDASALPPGPPIVDVVGTRGLDARRVGVLKVPEGGGRRISLSPSGGCRRQDVTDAATSCGSRAAADRRPGRKRADACTRNVQGCLAMMHGWQGELVSHWRTTGWAAVSQHEPTRCARRSSARRVSARTLILRLLRKGWSTVEAGHKRRSVSRAQVAVDGSSGEEDD